MKDLVVELTLHKYSACSLVEVEAEVEGVPFKMALAREIRLVIAALVAFPRDLNSQVVFQEDLVLNFNEKAKCVI